MVSRGRFAIGEDSSTNLPHQLENIKVFPLEIPGAGCLRDKKSPATVDGYISALRSQYLTHHSPGDSHVVAGLSLGGMIAAQWINRYQSDFQAAVLINTSGSQSPFYKRLLPSAALELAKVVLTRDYLKQEKVIASLICNTADTDTTAGLWAEVSRTAPISAVNISCQLISAIRYRFPESLSIPVLILASRNDRLVSSTCSEILGTILKQEIVFHPSAGHDLPTDEPDWCVSTIHGWLKNSLSLLT